MNDPGYGPILRMVFVFHEDHPFISGNHTHVPRKNGVGRVMTREAKAQAAYIRDVAIVAATQQRWKKPEYCQMEIVSINVKADGDNLRKPLQDAIQGIAFANDARILRDSRDRFKGKGASQIIVAIQAVHGKYFGYREAKNDHVLP